MNVDVVKMHGAENTFFVVDERPPRLPRYDELARALCAPGGDSGGADGILVLRDADGFSAEMQIYNADGSRAEMCGNGVRCVARYLWERGGGDTLTIATLAGPIATTIVQRDPFEVRVDIGPVTFPSDARPEEIAVEGETWTFFDVSLGNPHAVIFVDDVGRVELERLGAAFGVHARFPHGTNVHVVERMGGSKLRVRHFERGVGPTKACGTGAVACAAAAIIVHGVRSPVTVYVPGGVLRVEWQPGETARLSGPAERLFERSIVA